MCIKFTLMMIILFSSMSVLALEVDEKLTLRILNVSSTQKTILINRGVEDGLVVGDHARFFVPEGVIARGVIVRVAPTRSVWSIYRMVNPDYVKEEEVLSLKITQPVKLSDDPTRQIWQGEKDVKVMSPEARISVDPSAKMKINDDVLNSEDPELDELLNDREVTTSSKYEIFGGLYFSNQSSTATSNDTTIGAISGSQQSIVLLIGGEFYFKQLKSFLRDFSIAPFFQIDSNQVFGSQGTQTGTSFTDIGFMINYHPFKAKPWDVGKFIPYFNFTYALRSGSDTFDPGFEVTATQGSVAGQPESFAGDGSGSMFSIGGGVKTYLTNHWGMRIQVSYESSSVEFTNSKNPLAWTREGSGLKIMSSFGYRF